jgi:hypothetical protein
MISDSNIKSRLDIRLRNENKENNIINDKIKKINRSKLTQRFRANIIKLKPEFEEDDDGPELFKVQPSDEIPRNKLTDQLARGLQSFV